MEGKRPGGQPDIDEKNVEKRGIKGMETWRRRHGMTEIDGGFCPKLNPWTMEDTRLDREEAPFYC